MTLLQLKYIVTVAAAGTISEAAKQLYIAQPSLTSAIKELENELGITIFKRTNKGILLPVPAEAPYAPTYLTYLSLRKVSQ